MKESFVDVLTQIKKIFSIPVKYPSSRYFPGASPTPTISDLSLIYRSTYVTDYQKEQNTIRMKTAFFLIIAAPWTLLQVLASSHDEPIPVQMDSSFLNCGDDVDVCGVLTLESGLGRGNYHHRKPCVHGIWPQIGHFGSSKCVAPSRSSASPSKVYPCYDTARDDDSEEMAFELHEWKKHGVCAGVKDADDFFTQVCDLSKAPLAAMKEGLPFKEMVNSLRDAGFRWVEAWSFPCIFVSDQCG